MNKYYLGFAANYSKEDRIAHTFTKGRKEDIRDLENFLNRKYGGERTILTKNGRSALALALKANFKKSDGILVNGFTCYAVYEAIRAAGLRPIFVDIEKDDLNFSVDTLTKAFERANSAATKDIVVPRGIIIQNTLGNPVDIEKIENFAKEHDLTIIEDLAHSAGVKYADGREAGTVGVATIMSFGKEKSIDTVSGGAVIFRGPYKNPIKKPTKPPRASDHLRARFYPVLGALCRGLNHIKLGGVLMRCLIKAHWVERSADSKLDLERKISRFEANRAIIQIKSLSKTGERPLRDFCYVNDRAELLDKLREAGFYFDSFWYEKPVSPKRYYKKVHFPEKDCPNAVWVAKHIINIPIYYKKKDLEPARKIISEYLEDKR